MDLSQEKLAELANVSVQMIKGIEGCRTWVSDGMLAKLAGVLGVRAFQLLLPADNSCKEDENLAMYALLRNLKHNLLLDVEARFAKILPKTSPDKEDPVG